MLCHYVMVLFIGFCGSHVVVNIFLVAGVLNTSVLDLLVF